MNYLNFVIFTTLYLVFCTTGDAHQSCDYYWRSYTGIIPEDAVPGGLDKNNITTYIGNVFVNNRGIQPVRIYPGKDNVVASVDGIFTKNKYIQILCAHNKHNFIWLPATAANLHTDTINKRLVEAGVESEKILNIGRAQYQGELIVGKVCGYNAGNALMFFPYDGKEVNFASYEVLACPPSYLFGHLIDRRINVPGSQ